MRGLKALLIGMGMLTYTSLYSQDISERLNKIAATIRSIGIKCNYAQKINVDGKNIITAYLPQISHNNKSYQYDIRISSMNTVESCYVDVTDLKHKEIKRFFWNSDGAKEFKNGSWTSVSTTTISGLVEHLENRYNIKKK